MGRRKEGILGQARRLLRDVGIAAAIALAPRVASAEEQGREAPAPDEVSVTLESQSGPLLVELYNPKAKVGRDSPIARCKTPCFARVSPGRYRLFVHETSDTLAGGRIVELGESTAIAMSPDHPSQRSGGLALGIGGPVAALLGSLLLLSSSISCVDECQGQSGTAAPGLLLIIGGLVVTPIGWTMFARSFKPDLTLTPITATALGERRTFALPSGLRLGVTVSF